MWWRPGTVSHTGTARGAPGAGDQRVLAQELLALVAADHRDQRAARRRHVRRAEAARRGRASGAGRGARKGAWRSGSRSNTPESASARLHQVGRQVRRDLRPVGRRSIIAARWPPAEWPATTMRRGSPPCSAAWRQHPGQRAHACCSTICSMRDGRAQRVVGQHHHRAGGDERRRDEGLRRACRARASSRRGCRPAPARRARSLREDVERLAGVARRRRMSSTPRQLRARRRRRLGPVAAGSAGCSGMRPRLLYCASYQSAAVAGHAGARALAPRRALRGAPAAGTRVGRIGRLAQRRVDQRVGHPQRDALDLAVGQAPDVLQDRRRARCRRPPTARGAAGRAPPAAAAAPAARCACSRMRTRWPRR